MRRTARRQNCLHRSQSVAGTQCQSRSFPSVKTLRLMLPPPPRPLPIFHSALPTPHRSLLLSTFPSVRGHMAVPRISHFPRLSIHLLLCSGICKNNAILARSVVRPQKADRIMRGQNNIRKGRTAIPMILSSHDSVSAVAGLPLGSLRFHHAAYSPMSHPHKQPDFCEKGLHSGK